MFSNVMWSNLELILSRKINLFLFLFFQQFIHKTENIITNDHYNAEHQLL